MKKDCAFKKLEYYSARVAFVPNALVAQGIEHRIPNPGVARSIRAEGTNKNKGLSRIISWLALIFFFIAQATSFILFYSPFADWGELV